MSKPALSLVVVAYNMARELPRTIRSLSPSMQRGIAEGEYEVIVVDNGSTKRFDEADCRRWMSAITFKYLPGDSPSPVGAINEGIAMARGDVVGVFIDGARMASPGLLSAALAASRLHDRPAIGSFGFHLGPEKQTLSILKGYDQSVEDSLLDQSGWENDGYKLFGISVFASSSGRGWFVLPRETNSLFLKAEHWAAIGGYDNGFQAPGGGLANADIWQRLCSDPAVQVIMLLGEGTFHQIHGGIATNSPQSDWDRYHDEYVRVRGHDIPGVHGKPLLFGRVDERILESISLSCKRLARQVEKSAKRSKREAAAKRP